MTGASEKRRFHRVAHDAWASLQHGGQTWACTVQDLSLKGCLLRSDTVLSLDRDKVYQLDVHLTYSNKIAMRVQLCHQDAHQLGVCCVEIDADSIAKLKRLVELNLGDSSLLERDMHMLLGGV